MLQERTQQRDVQIVASDNDWEGYSESITDELQGYIVHMRFVAGQEDD